MPTNHIATIIIVVTFILYFTFIFLQRDIEPNKIYASDSLALVETSSVRDIEPNKIYASDSLVLVEISKRNPHTTLNWNFSKPLEILKGVELNKEGRVVSLTLKVKKLTHLPHHIGNLTELQKLDLTFNKIEELPPEIGNLKNLEELYLGDNDLSVLPPEIGNLENLQKLNLIENSLITLSSQIGNLKNLQ